MKEIQKIFISIKNRRFNPDAFCKVSTVFMLTWKLTLV